MSQSWGTGGEMLRNYFLKVITLEHSNDQKKWVSQQRLQRRESEPDLKGQKDFLCISLSPPLPWILSAC